MKANKISDMLLACGGYAILQTLLIYKNYSSITAPIWTASLMLLVGFGLKTYDYEFKKDSWFLVVVTELIGLSSMFTDNTAVIAMNYIAIFLLLVTLLIHNCIDDRSWDFTDYLSRILISVFGAIEMLPSMIRDYGSERTASVSQTDMEGTGDSGVVQEEVQGTRGVKTTRGKYRPILKGIFISIPCIVFLLLLLASADMVFAQMLENMFEEFGLGDVLLATIMTCISFMGAYCGIKFIAERLREDLPSEVRKSGPVTVITVLSLVTVVYLVFSIIQIAFLFTGMELPLGITYAEYAKTGFYQLLFVCIINLLVVLIIKKRVEKNGLLNGLLCGVTACTYIMLASSSLRMIMYIEAYGLTFLRVFVMVALFTIAVLLIGVVIAIFREDFSFFRYGICVLAIVYTSFAFSHVDYFIADYNLNSGRVESVDYSYIRELSCDAAPVIEEYCRDSGIIKDNSQVNNWYWLYRRNIRFATDNLSVRSYNISRAYARRLLR